LTGRFSKPSDVYSFGLVLWEMVTRCAVDPFASMHTVEQLGTYLESGGRLQMPEASPAVFKQLVVDCCQWRKDLRPAFSDICYRLTRTFCIDLSAQLAEWDDGR
jgi:hypothetical protein